MYNNMDISYSTGKDQNNIEKHGVSLAEAVNIDWSTALVIEDARRNYGEVRMIGYGLIADRLYCVVYTDRSQDRRIISLRKANHREVIRYGQA